MGLTSRSTKQKIILDEELMKFKTIFTAEELLHTVQQRHKRVGVATIYRFLKAKTAQHEIHTYTCDRRQVYSLQQNNHCHFICTHCGHTTHFDLKEIDFLKANNQGKACHFQLDVYGICKRCEQKPTE